MKHLKLFKRLCSPYRRSVLQTQTHIHICIYKNNLNKNEPQSKVLAFLQKFLPNFKEISWL